MTLTGYRFDLTCASCGGALDHVADGAPQAGTHATAVAKCSTCRAEWIVTATLRRCGGYGIKR